MKNILKTVLLFSIAILMNSCLDYDELRENPNDPINVPPSLLFTRVTPKPISTFTDSYSFAQYHIRNNSDGSPVDYQFGSGGFNFGVLRDLNRMIEEANRSNNEVYVVLAKFLRAYYFVDMTRDFGDVPLSEAMLGQEIPQPKYDTQKSVYLQALNWLDEANEELGVFISNNPSYVLEGDFYYFGNLSQWQKAINAYTLRVLVSLSKKSNDSELNVQGRFSNIINNPAKYPLMSGLFDNMQVEHQDKDGFRGPYNPDNAAYANDIVLVSTYIDLLKNNEDPRLMIVADPTPNSLTANPDEEAVRANFSSYVGADISVSTAENAVKRVNGDLSYPNQERYNNFVGQPSVLLSYYEQELNIAEAANRGWISSNASNHYENGVAASMEFYGVEENKISDYLNTKAPYISGASGLNRIHEQMYIAFAENSGWESFFLTRRTGVPTYKFSSENNVSKIPVRWAYPVAEQSDNKDNYTAALISQFGSEVDDRDQIIWILQD
ncbi:MULTISPECIES: SusD/RagB family nutrient-binding outer membrane lipoprotein [Flavobacteriaceae]|uniref:SusD/RagB family nutrient-binding outer membrane lipoprotein n=2 Tax=Flavobacteriaceae TaxID=49546 RepID=A0A4Y8AUG5_9FLAO|nr:MULTISPECIES: SusD/RagB family nutrient-binding outer membrane lipoprotein [Flavobacteriaceae]TEW75534.1 SusD/RagB family nutrient-binding outer membrane lipoprotein [Gramella jeungdoensis]GGK46001.1 hypothetical protein GCM10007963_12830 [Lutibacter litoralis]